MEQLIISMAILNSYIELPEGILLQEQSSYPVVDVDYSIPYMWIENGTREWPLLPLKFDFQTHVVLEFKEELQHAAVLHCYSESLGALVRCCNPKPVEFV